MKILLMNALTKLMNISKIKPNIMTPEQLMQPRWKVIEWYPDSEFKVGDSENRICSILFKKLEWWQDRSSQDMPQYILRDNAGLVYKVTHWDIHHSGNAIAWCDGEAVIASYCQPATEADFNSQPNTENLSSDYFQNTPTISYKEFREMWNEVFYQNLQNGNTLLLEKLMNFQNTVFEKTKQKIKNWQDKI